MENKLNKQNVESLSEMNKRLNIIWSLNGMS